MQPPALFTIPMAKEANVEARINRILDHSRALPKSFSGAGWLALIAVAAPTIYFVAAAQLAPAQTLIPIPAPHPPAAPVVVAQAAPPPPTPALLSPPGTQVELATPPRPQRIELPQGNIAIMLQQLAAALTPDGLWPPDNLFSRDRARAEQLPEAPSQADPDTKISVNVSAERNVKLSIPLGASIEHHVLIEIYSQDGHLVRTGERRIVGMRWDLNVLLLPGSYHLRAVIKKAADGSMAARGFDFEVQ